jgi:hypothetical protein
MPPASPYTGKVLMEKADSWHNNVSPSLHQARLDSLLTALKNLADAGLWAASVLANLHHRRIVPIMERELRIYEMARQPTRRRRRARGSSMSASLGNMRLRGRGVPLALWPSGTATTTSGHSVCSPTPRR